MKVALIGNMNNNFFALMRYLRDSGIDAYLLMFADEIEHFKPENDTWEIEKWRPYVKQLDLVGGALGQYFRMSAEQIRKQFEGYDFYIGCGFTPAYFYKAKLQLDIFTPYCVGIEYTYRITKTKLIHSLKEKIEAYYQVRGLKNNVTTLATLDEESIKKAKTYGIPIEPLPVPLLYNKGFSNVNDLEIQQIVTEFKKYYPVVFSHVSHFQTNSVTYSIKRNDVLIKGFASFVKKGVHNPLLVLFDYGEGVGESKNLINALGIENRVKWLPLMSRKKIMALLQQVDFGAAEFGGHMWGGTGWEFFASGIPPMQCLNMSKDEFEHVAKIEYPFFFNVSSPEGVESVLSTYSGQKDQLRVLGNRAKAWCEENMAQRMVIEYINILQKNNEV